MAYKIELVVSENIPVTEEEKRKLIAGYIPGRIQSLFKFKKCEESCDVLFDKLPLYLEGCEETDKGCMFMTATQIKEYLDWNGSVEGVGKVLSAYGVASKIMRMPHRGSDVKIPKKVYLCRPTS